MKKTTISISEETALKLLRKRETLSETYEDVILKLLESYNQKENRQARGRSQ